VYKYIQTAKEGSGGDDQVNEALRQIDAINNELDTAAYAIEGLIFFVCLYRK
jgi:hypothetical protein